MWLDSGCLRAVWGPRRYGNNRRHGNKRGQFDVEVEVRKETNEFLEFQQMHISDPNSVIYESSIQIGKQTSVLLPYVVFQVVHKKTGIAQA